MPTITNDDHISLFHASGQSLTFHGRVVHVRESAAMLAAGTLREPLREFEIRDLPALERHFVESGRRLNELARIYPDDPGVVSACENHQARACDLGLIG